MNENVIQCGLCGSENMRVAINESAKQLLAECSDCSNQTLAALDGRGLLVKNAKIELGLKFPVEEVVIMSSILNVPSGTTLSSLNPKSDGNIVRQN